MTLKYFRPELEAIEASLDWDLMQVVSGTGSDMDDPDTGQDPFDADVYFIF